MNNFIECLCSNMCIPSRFAFPDEFLSDDNSQSCEKLSGLSPLPVRLTGTSGFWNQTFTHCAEIFNNSVSLLSTVNWKTDLEQKTPFQPWSRKEVLLRCFFRMVAEICEKLAKNYAMSVKVHTNITFIYKYYLRTISHIH